MVEALLVAAGAATVWAVQWFTRRRRPPQQHERLIGVSEDGVDEFVLVSFYAPDGWNPNIQITRHHFPRDRNMTDH